jgi:hypothetical protein
MPDSDAPLHPSSSPVRCSSARSPGIRRGAGSSSSRRRRWPLHLAGLSDGDHPHGASPPVVGARAAPGGRALPGLRVDLLHGHPGGGDLRPPQLKDTAKQVSPSSTRGARWVPSSPATCSPWSCSGRSWRSPRPTWSGPGARKRSLGGGMALHLRAPAGRQSPPGRGPPARGRNGLPRLRGLQGGHARELADPAGLRRERRHPALHAWLADAYPRGTVTGRVFLRPSPRRPPSTRWPGASPAGSSSSGRARHGALRRHLRRPLRRHPAPPGLPHREPGGIHGGGDRDRHRDGPERRHSPRLHPHPLQGAPLHGSRRRALRHRKEPPLGPGRPLRATCPGSWAYMVGALSISGFPLFSGLREQAHHGLAAEYAST